jgi:hypothetical protein
MSRMTSVAMLGVCLCLLPAGPLRAASMTIDGDSPRESVTLTVEDAPVDMVLESLRTKYGFEIGGLENANQGGDALSITLSGSLYNIIERLLRNRNHVIVRSPDNVSGIEKVMILDASYGAGPPKASARGTGSNVPGKMLQANSSDKSPGPAMTGRHNHPDD